MKKVLWLIVCLMTMVVSVNAQNGWETRKSGGDELKGYSPSVAHLYKCDEGDICFFDGSESTFMVSTYNGFFDYDVDDYVKGAIIGLYDINDNLIEKIKTPTQRTFWVGEKNHHIMVCVKKDVGEKIVSFLKNQKGFVRIIAERYSRSDFDIKIPCMNN